jgi:fumarate hydratase subunit alpha
MRQIDAQDVERAAEALLLSLNYGGSKDLQKMLEEAFCHEESEMGKIVLKQLLENRSIAEREKIPLCQDTGLVVMFVDIGEDLRIEGGSLEKALNEGVRRAYRGLRKSVCHPLTRRNTGDNTPSIVHVRLVKGEGIRIRAILKGGGSENCSALRMLSPYEGKEGIKEFLLDVVSTGGPNPCPPLIIGIGIGGDMELAALLSKEALLEPYGRRHEDPDIAAFEIQLLEEVNKTGIGPQGYGGRVTVLDLHIKTAPCHIASLPCAINVGCHAHRVGEVLL